MDRAMIRYLAAGFVASCIVGGLLFSVQPSNSSASDATTSTGPADEGEVVVFPYKRSQPTSESADNSLHRDEPSQRVGGALARLDAAVEQVEARYASIWKTFTSSNSPATQEVTRFAYLTLTVENGVITTISKEAWAPVADHVQWMKKSVASAKRVRKDAQRAMRTFNVGADATTSNLDPAINAIIEMAFLSEVGSRSGAGKTKQYERRACELLVILKPYVPANRADKVRQAEKDCKAKGY